MERVAVKSSRTLVTKLINGAKDLLTQNENVNELIVMRDRLISANENLEIANQKMVPILEVNEMEKQCEKMLDYQDNISEMLARLNIKIGKQDRPQDEARSARSNDYQGRSNVKLSKLELRKFNGDISEWSIFWEQFRTAVHENDTIEPSAKYNYLDQCLRGKAKNTISGFTPSEKSYNDAINLLKNEYGNEQRIIDHHIQKLLNITPVKNKLDAASLRNLYNTISAISRSLLAAGVKENEYGIMIKSVLLNTMPYVMKIEYYKMHPIDPQITIGKQINDLLNYLKREVESIEIAQPTTSKTQETEVTKKHERRDNKNENYKSQKNYTTARLLTTAVNECLFCKSKQHNTENCNSKDITIQQKKDILTEEKRCFRCTKSSHNSRFCRSKSNCGNCKRRHVTSMCDPNYVKEQTNASNNAVSLFTKNNENSVFLQTAKAYIGDLNETSSNAFIRLVIDGGSQLSYIKESVSRKLNLKIIGTRKLIVMPFGSETRKTPKIYNKIEITLTSQYENKSITITAIEVPEICYDAFQTPNVNHPLISTLNMADASIGNIKTINGIVLLIGADNYWKIATGEFIRLTEDLTAINTKLGWTLQGPNIDNDNEDETSAAVVVSALNVQGLDENADVSIQQFWKLETIGINDRETQSDFTNEFMQNKIILKNKRYEASLPWKIDCPLHNNFNNALARMKSLTFKLTKEAKIITYDQAIRELINNGIAEKVTTTILPEKMYYMPHRPVYREDKTTSKVRVVFDASNHSQNCPSLNQLLHSGENLVNDLMRILLNFRNGKIAIIADIEKAYLQIKLSERDKDCHRFLWYEHSITDTRILPPMQEYRMTRVCFGVTSSAFILSVTLKKMCSSESTYVDTAKCLLNSFYVDDLILTVNSLNDAIKLYNESKNILKTGSMNLRKWHTNDVDFQNYIKQNEIENNSSICPKVLGLYWDTTNDNLYLDLTSIISFVNENKSCTKRNVSRAIGRIYDPLCIMGPFTIKAKILLQQIWKLKNDWDEEVPSEFKVAWEKWCNDLRNLDFYVIPRNIVSNTNSKFELHVFSDASQTAYGAAAYLREIMNDEVGVNLLIAKNRVASLKGNDSTGLTVAKLELTAALCASRLKDYLIKNLNIKFESVNLWTDSKITLYWITGDAARWKPYVQNRVTEIQNVTKDSVWRHCVDKLNPADLLTRGVNANELLHCEYWLNGPKFLSCLNDDWLIDNNFNEIFNEESLCAINVSETNCKTEPIFSLDKYEQLEKCLRITAYVKRAFRKIKSSPLELTAEEINEAERYWIKMDQRIFKNEINDLKKNNTVNKNSSIYKLTPFIDEDGLLRIKSRLQESELSYDTANPIILAKNSVFVEKLIWKIHNGCFHSGINLTLAELRKRFWVIRGRQKIKTTISKCVICKKLRGKRGHESFAPLPRERILMSRPFENTGVDFAGPLYVLNEGNEKRKSYLMLLTCAVTRAVHLELVLDITTESCIRGLRRFISRRGVPSTFYSDNAKTFKRTSLELTRLYDMLPNEEMTNFSTKQRVGWKFIVERAAWWGGFWERMIKVVKDCLKFALGKLLVNIEELRTILTEIEATVNSRPLTYIDDDKENLVILSPSNFLLGNQQECNLPSSNVNSKRDVIMRKWNERQRILLKFWKRWSADYLQQLRTAHGNKWPSSTKPFKIDDVVLVHDQCAPRLNWKMATISQVYPGRDGKIRACEVRLANKTLLRRPIQLLYPLEIQIAGREDVENISEVRSNEECADANAEVRQGHAHEKEEFKQ